MESANSKKQLMYTKIQTYRGMLLNPTMNLRNRLGVSGLIAKDKMLVYLITYILTPRSSNHAQVTDDDLHVNVCMQVFDDAKV